MRALRGAARSDNPKDYIQWGLGNLKDRDEIHAFNRMLLHARTARGHSRAKISAHMKENLDLAIGKEWIAPGTEREWRETLESVLTTLDAPHRPPGVRPTPTVSIVPQDQTSAAVTIQNLAVRVGGPHPGQPLHTKISLSLGVAKRLSELAQKGPVHVTSSVDWIRGPQLRLIAGEGPETLIIDRTRSSGPNGQMGTLSGLRIQFGVGEGARAFLLDRTSKGQDAGGGRIKLKKGSGTLIDPLSPELAADSAARPDGTVLWHARPTRKLTTDLRRALEGYNAQNEADIHGEWIEQPFKVLTHVLANTTSKLPPARP